jgi:hypothetical protein
LINAKLCRLANCLDVRITRPGKNHKCFLAISRNVRKLQQIESVDSSPLAYILYGAEEFNLNSGPLATKGQDIEFREVNPLINEEYKQMRNTHLKIICLAFALGIIMTFTVMPTAKAWSYATAAERTVTFWDNRLCYSKITLRVEGNPCAPNSPEFYYQNSKHYVYISLSDGMYLTNVVVTYQTENYYVTQNKGTVTSLYTQYSYLRSQLYTCAIKTIISFDIHIPVYIWGWFVTYLPPIHHQFYIIIPDDGLYPFPNPRHMYY